MKENSYHKENLKQELIEAGIRIVAEEGFGALTLRRLAKECNVSHAAPYKHFQNKEEILLALSEYAHQQFAASLSKTLDSIPDKDAETRIIELGKSYIEFLMERPYYMKVLFIGDATDTLSGDTPCGMTKPDMPLDIFRKTAIEYLKAAKIPPEHYEYSLVSMWGIVYGLTLILVNGNWKPREEWKTAVEKILRGGFHC